MSKRTESLPPLSGIAHIWREVRYHEAGRQLSSVILVILSGIFGSPYEPLFIAGAVLVIIGLGIRLWASGYIVKNSELCSSGPYAWVRHPLYTGNIALLVGFVLASSLWWCALGAAFILFTFYPVTIAYEDKQMLRRFPDTWPQWGPEIPAILPSFSRHASLQSKPWSLRLSVRRNGEPAAAALMLYLLYLLGSRLGG